MADKKFKLSMAEARDLVWKELMQENEENFTDSFRNQVLLVIQA
ncbi:hypothetical protein LCGC14_1368190, partial [marine sediment metagenome]